MDRGAWWATWDLKESFMTEQLTVSLSLSPLTSDEA